MRGEFSSLLLSLFLAFCLWLNLAGLDASALDLAVPLEFKGLPQNLLLRGDVPGEAVLKLRANAAQVRFLSEHKLSLPVDLSAVREGRNAIPVQLEPLNLPRGVVVDEVSPSLIEFEALAVSVKTVRVEPNVVGRPTPPFKLKGVKLSPDEAVLQGPPEALSRVDRLETNPIAVDGLTESSVLAVMLISPEDSAELSLLSPKEIKAAVEIEEDRARAVFPDVPVEIDVRGGDRLRTSFIAKPARVRVSVSWPESRDSPVAAGDIRARVAVDGEQLEAEGRLVLPVTALPPAGAEVTGINPATVEVSYVPGAAASGDGAARRPR